jgi:hypothetical protein
VVGGEIKGDAGINLACKFDQIAIPPGLTPYTDENEVFSFFFPTEFQEIRAVRRVGEKNSYSYEVGDHVGRGKRKGFWEYMRNPQLNNGLFISFYESAETTLSEEWWNNAKWDSVKKTVAGMFFKDEDDVDQIEILSQYVNADARRSVIGIKRWHISRSLSIFVVTRFDEADGMIMLAEATLMPDQWEDYRNAVFNSLLSIQWSPSKARTMVHKMSGNP